MKHILSILLFCLFVSPSAKAVKFMGLRVIDKNYLMVHLRDGEVRYEDDGKGPGAYLGHTSAEDTLVVFGKRLQPNVATKTESWSIRSKEDKNFTKIRPLAVWRKSKPMNTDHTLTSELDHWLFLHLPQGMKQGCTYTVTLPEGMEADVKEASVTFDIWRTPSEAVHVNIIGYTPHEAIHPADLYLWLGDGGQRDYASFEGKNVYLYNVKTGRSRKAGKVRLFKKSLLNAFFISAKSLTKGLPRSGKIPIPRLAPRLNLK